MNQIFVILIATALQSAEGCSRKYYNIKYFLYYLTSVVISLNTAIFYSKHNTTLLCNCNL